MKTQLMDHTFFTKIKQELSKLNVQVNSASIGGQISQSYIPELKPQTCTADIRKKITQEEMRQYLKQA